jgi:hypothetical protein
MATKLKIEKRGMIFLNLFPIGSYVKLSSAVQPSWSEGRTTGHIFGREPSNDFHQNFVLIEQMVSDKKIFMGVLYPRWPPLLKIEISSNGQNCSFLCQNVPKFELYKHNDELFSIYYRIFYEL